MCNSNAKLYAWLFTLTWPNAYCRCFHQLCRLFLFVLSQGINDGNVLFAPLFTRRLL